MTNPNNAIGTNGAYGGRTSVNAFNDNLAIYQGRGVLSGFVVSPNAGMSVAIGGDGTTRDVAIAEDNIGNKTTINNISESPISLTIAGAPVSNSRIDAVVAYVDNPAQGSATETDNPGACGLIAVQGTVAPTPSEPDENAIRTAITADGASGTTAYFVVLGYITIANGTTDITSEMIEQGSYAIISLDSIGDNSIPSGKFDWLTVCEVVSNTNGIAYKFGNGLMFCTVAKEVTTDATYGVTRWDYPVAFISAPVVCSNTTRTSGYKNALARVDGTNPTYVQFAWINASDNSQLKSETIPAFSAIAIGNWK